MEKSAVYSDSGILDGNENEQTTGTCNNRMSNKSGQTEKMRHCVVPYVQCSKISRSD